VKLVGLLFINQINKPMKVATKKSSSGQVGRGAASNNHKVSSSVSTKNTYPGEKREKRPNEMPEKQESENERLEYPHETEFRQQDKGNDTQYGEQGDVTPPAPHEFPSVGNAKTDFASRPHGRTTGRMVGHEPGTEGI
jgi:hypothetical protein